MDLVNKVLNSTVGRNNDGTPKSAITLTCLKYNLDTDFSRENGSISVQNPEIKIQARDPYTQIDLIFNSDFDDDLRTIWSLLEKYGQEINDYDISDEEFPLLSLIIAPLSERGKYYINATNPIIWVLQPVRPGGKNNIIRLLFEEDGFGIYETDEVDIDKEKAIIEQEEASRQFIEEQVRRKEEEEYEYQLERERKIEEMRQLNTGTANSIHAYRKKQDDNKYADTDDDEDDEYEIHEFDFE